MTKGEQEAHEELKAARKKIWEQEKEINRKDKALAEMAAIVTLQKNGTAVSGSKGRLILQERRIVLCGLIDDVVHTGARVAPTCAAIGIHARTYRRWKDDPTDRRKESRKPNRMALSPEERKQIIDVCFED